MDVLRRGAARSASLTELVNQLEALGTRSTVEGWTRADTARRVELERRIADRVQTPNLGWRGRGVRCALEVEIQARAATIAGVVRAVRTGGILLELASRPRLSPTLELRVLAPWASGRRRPVRGQIVGIDGPLLRIALRADDDAERRWTRRFVIDAVRSRVEWTGPTRSTIG